MAKFGVGASLGRKEDARHLAGKGQFVADLRIPGTLDVAFVRSPYAHARVGAIRKPTGAEDRVFTAADLSEIRPVRVIPEIPGFKGSDYPPLATEKVRFVGEPVAICIASTRAKAEDLAQATEVDYQELPAVVDVVEALNPGAAILHDGWADNQFVGTTVEGGDIEAAKAEATVVVEREYRMNRQTGVPMEGRAIHVNWEDRRNELMIYCSTQFPHQYRAGLSYLLGIPEHEIHVIAPDVGGGFGMKNTIYAEELVVVALARRLRRPLRWIDDRREHLLTSMHCREHFHRVKAYANDQGKVLGIDVEIFVDAGAYSHWPNSPFMETGMAAKNIPGPYAIGNYRAVTHTVATSKAPQGPYRGVARPAACFTIERTIDEVARAVGREPHEVRSENMVNPEMMPYRSVTNLLFDIGDYPRGVAMAVELIDLPAVRARQAKGESDGRLIGVGFAAYTEQTAHGCGEWVTRGTPVIPGYESATARLLSDGTILVFVGIQSHGQGLETTLAQVVHQELGIDPANVSVRHGDTESCPFGMGTFASRTMVMSGGAVARASRMMREKMAKIAAHLLQCGAEEVEFRDGQVFGPQGSVTFEEIGHTAYLRQERLPPGVEPMVDVTTTYEPGIDTGVFTFSIHAAVVAVDPATGVIELIDYGVVEDCGTIVNPMIVKGQITGGVAQGIGTALYEEIPYDANGQPLATTFADYLMPGAPEIPAIKIAHFETPTPHTEYGMKGMGEGGAIAPPAAIANAVRDALVAIGAEVNETPMTPRRVRAAIVAAELPRAAE
ncbi:MAG: xanthine dehydrogenase family protein molybdopterin-binding subunit [Proteobacteria bacterium]|nr:xanthine dehydrogenase family protein molybdopterin-binding subunit [Pseudomonadota bacterium]